ncbi:hypothetical protein [Mammaliicoccus sciuri]|uniref:hypothetical protein n=1 Tax=Mammaliicoccus sciuri TaxID=1296 RepID=UPI002DBC0B5C|nr:hypothetical protein [Mammaliicoccus sciuri]MEB5568344.1 hypothetical protein [Mammaliicoccus sciuri]
MNSYVINEVLKTHGVDNPALAKSLETLFMSLASDKAFTDKLYKEIEKKMIQKERNARYFRGGKF